MSREAESPRVVNSVGVPDSRRGSAAPRVRPSSAIARGEAALGLLAPRVLLSLLPVAAAPAVAVAAANSMGWEGWWLGALAGCAALLVGVVLAQRGLASFQASYLRPLEQAVQSLEDFRGDRQSSQLREVGAPLAQALARSINQARAMVEHRERLSQANLMSVEVAFDRIHTVLHSLNEGVILVDVRGRIVLANPYARRLLDDGNQPIEGRDLFDLLAPGLCMHVRRGFDQMQSGEGRGQVEVMGLQVGERYVDVSIVNVQSSGLDQTFGTMVAIVDVTRNHEIARLKEEFIASISHELRTPLTNICAFTEILGDVTPANESDWREFVEIVSLESHRLKGLVEDILEHNRLQMGQVEWSFEQVDLGEQARGVVGLCLAAAEEKKIDLQLTEGDGDAAASCDRDGVRQVLSRILDNALKFTPIEGRIVVEVTPLGNVVEIVVEDSGPGISIEHRETVFDRFCQIGDIMTEKPSGTGLGLPICRSLIDGHGRRSLV